MKLNLAPLVEHQRLDREKEVAHTHTLTSIDGEFLLQVVVGLFGDLVGGAVLGLVLIQEATDLLDPLQRAVVVFINQTLDPAA